MCDSIFCYYIVVFNKDVRDNFGGLGTNQVERGFMAPYILRNTAPVYCPYVKDCAGFYSLFYDSVTIKYIVDNRMTDKR
jgi:hypothetical protein